MTEKQQKARNIGIKVTPPKETCNDKHCPFHGNIPVRGRIFTGIVVASKTPKMATVEWERRVLVPKYERYRKKRTKLVVHNPPCINAKLGDIVRIIETRPISKMKKFTIIETIGKEELMGDVLEARTQGKDKKKEEEKKPKEKPQKKEKTE